MSGDPPITDAETVVRCKACGRDLPASAGDGSCPTCVRQALFDATLTGEPKPRFAAPTVAQLDRWLPSCEVLEVAGAGGMGYVYKARQVALDRFVAIKVLPVPGAASAAGSGNFLAEQFLLEARAMARLSHPNIVGIHDFGSTGDGYFYFIMEFIDGVGLDEFARVSRPTVLEALRLILPICDALDFAHGQRIVHRDIKPANILVSAHGQVKVADFGIAKLAGADGEGPIMGTPGFMAPEQKVPGAGVDGRADLYSLGVLVYEMMTGEMPAVNRKSVSAPGRVSVRLDAFLARALEEDPEARFGSAAAMKAELEDVIRHQELMTGGVLPERKETRGGAGAVARLAGRFAWLCVLALLGTVAYLGVQKWKDGGFATKPAARGEPGVRRFANREGRGFEGEALSHFGPVIRIRDREGKVWPLPITTLSEEGQVWVREWQRKHAATPGEGDVTLGARRPVGAALQRVRDTRYEITVGNATETPLPGLVLEYRFFFEDAKLRNVGGRVPLPPMAPGATKVVGTAPIEKPGPNSRTKDEKPDVKPILLGVWARVSHGGRVIAEYKDGGLRVADWNAGGRP